MLGIFKRYVKTKPIILVMLILPIVACGFLGMDDAELVKSAKQYLDKDDLGAAAIELRNALQKNSENAEARYLLGVIYLDVGDVSTAEKEFRRAAESGWNKEEATIGLARALLQQGNAQKILDEITIKDSYSTSARANLLALRAAAEAVTGSVALANVTIAEAEQLDANAFHVMKTRAQLQFINKETDNAKDTLANALNKYPDSAELLLMNARLAVQENDAASASKFFQTVIDSEPQKIITGYARFARLGLARLQILTNDLVQAEATLQPLLARSNNDPETNYFGGMLAFKQNKYDLAEERLLKVLKVAPDHAPTGLLFGTVSFAQKDYEQASHYLGKYLATSPENLGARKLLGRTQMMLGLHQEAQDTLKPALAGQSGDAELLALIGLSDIQKGDTQAGILGLKKAVVAAPDSAELRSELAKAYITAGETDEAIKELQGIIAKGGEQNKAEALLISAYLRSGQNEQAIYAAKDMLGRNSGNPAVTALLGNVYAVTGDLKEARNYLNKALQIKPDLTQAVMLLGRIEEKEGNDNKAIGLYKSLIDTGVDSITPMMALARHALKNKNDKEMVAWLEKALGKSPEAVRPRVILAEHYLREKQSTKAQTLVNEGLKKSKLPALVSLQARIMVSDKRYNEALKPLNELVEKLPDAILPRVQLGDVYMRLGQGKEAREHLEIALQRGPEYVPALVLMAKVDLKDNKTDQTIKLAKKIRQINPDSHIGYELEGDAWFKKEIYGNAESFFRQAWEKRQSSLLAIKYSESMVRLGKQNEAYKPVLAWLEKQPDDIRLRSYLAMAYQNQKQNDKAIQQYEKVLEAEPENPTALNNLAWLYLSTNQSKALELSERAYKANPKASGILDTYGWLLVLKGEAKKGRRLLKEALDKLPKVADVRYHYAVALIKTGDKAEGQKQLKDLLSEGHPFDGVDEAKKLVTQ
jgi:putative PEP-CTERM system TPR-repeat lipoprotein